MAQVIYRYRFGPRVPLKRIERWLHLAVVAAAGVHGATAVQMDACFGLDKRRRACVIGAHTEVGRDIARILTSFLHHEFKTGTFEVSAVDPPNGCTCKETHACPVPLP